MKEPADVNRFHMAEAGCGRRQVCSVDTGLSCRGITCGWLLCPGRQLRDTAIFISLLHSVGRDCSSAGRDLLASEGFSCQI